MTNLQRLGLAATAVAAGVTAVPLKSEIIKETAPLRTQIDGPVIIPADTRSHLLFVNVMVNGQGPFRMFVDTGCSYTVVLFAPQAQSSTTGDVPENPEHT